MGWQLEFDSMMANHLAHPMVLLKDSGSPMGQGWVVVMGMQTQMGSCSADGMGKQTPMEHCLATQMESG
jgi:hypothetical protein